MFVFFGRSIDIYVVPGEEWSFRNHFDALAMSEVETAKQILARRFGKPTPDVTIDETRSRAWLTAD